ncbi:MAG: PKD domain-containing protein, partial [Candidatus Aminicenantes bacterium]|nr:PKD domain-containing protein [Candidatus Aminicenantes bacterium]
IVIKNIDIAQLFISAEPMKLPPGGGKTTITVTAVNSDVEPVEGKKIWLETTAGTLTPASPLITDNQGNVTAQLETTVEATVTATYKEVVKTIDITIGVNTPPTADFEFSPQNPFSGDTVHFISTSTDEDGTIKKHQWNFGDGSTSDQENPSHKYPDVSVETTYMVKLTVEDDGGETASVIKPIVISVTDNKPPVAAFSYSPQEPMVGDTIYFISESTDEDGTIVAYQWYFGDGSASTLKNPSHRYNVTQAATFNVQLIVTDDGGKTGSITQGITLGSIENKAPTADFSYTPENPVIGDTIQFVSESTDEDGWIASWQWDFGDGSTSTQENPQHQYNVNEQTVFAVKLTVTDNSGQTASKTKSITISEQENTPPTAAFSFSPSAPLSGDVVYFNAGTSTDPDGTITQYQWDFGDGASGTGQTAQHTYNVTVTTTFTVVLTVIDDGGAQGVTSQPVTVTVVENQPPTADFDFSPTNPKSGDNVLFNASASSDPDGTIVQYHWDFGDGYTGTGINPTHTYNVSSDTTFTIVLTVTDDGGAQGVTSKQITVT